MLFVDCEFFKARWHKYNSYVHIACKDKTRDVPSS